MGAVTLGRYTRVRWKPASADILAKLDGDCATSLVAAALLDGANEAWGLAPDQSILLAGNDVGPAALAEEEHGASERIAQQQADIRSRLFEEYDDDEYYWPSDVEVNACLSETDRQLVASLRKRHQVDQNLVIHLPARMPDERSETLPTSGIWLVGIEHGASSWAALRSIRQMDFDELQLDWSTIILPGSGPIVMGRPKRGNQPFDLISPPPRGDTLQAQLDDEGVLLTMPFRHEKIDDEKTPPTELDQLKHYLDGICHQVSTCYRYGVLVQGVMSWLNIQPGVRVATVTPTTSMFRSRLALFRRELAARAIYYEDDANEAGYELRFAIEDGAVPSNFHEQNAALAYTVSGDGRPEDDKREQARQAYDPENDWETGQLYGVDYSAMPARVDVTRTELVIYTSEFTGVGGSVVNDTWVEAHLDMAGLAAGLEDGASRYPSLTAYDIKRLEEATEPLPIGWNAVEAADRIQRAVYAMVTRDAGDSKVEARLSRLRDPIVRALLNRDALSGLGDRDLAEAVAGTAPPPPSARGPFPSRAYAVIALAEACMTENRDELAAAAIEAAGDPLEQKLAMIIAKGMIG